MTIYTFNHKPDDFKAVTKIKKYLPYAAAQ